MADISVLMDTLIASCIPHDMEPDTIKDCRNNYNRVSSFLREEQLRGTQFIFYKIVSRSYDNGIQISWRYMESLFQFNAKKFIRDKQVAIKSIFPDVKVAELVDIEKERVVIAQLTQLLKEQYENYAKEIVTFEEVNASLDILKQSMQEEELKTLLMNASKILFQGEEVRNGNKSEYMSGSADTLKYLLAEAGSINNKYTDGDGSKNWYHIKSYDDLQEMRSGDERSYDFVTDTGIEMLDSATGGLFTTQILGLQGHPGVGKSRFASKIMYRAKVIHGKNVHYISMEQHCNELSMYFTSQHCWYKYGRYITDKQLKLYFVSINHKLAEFVTDKEKIELADELPLTDEEIQIVNEAELDLYSNPNYGEILYDNSYPPVEGLESHIRNIHFNHMREDVLCIDHMSILISDGSLTRGIPKNQTEIITDGMKILKRLCQRLNFFVIAVNQLTREEVNRALEGKQTRITGSANAAEFERSCDIMWNLGATPQQEEANKCFVDSPKARDSGKPSRVLLDTKKGVCVYEQSKQQESA